MAQQDLRLHPKERRRAGYAWQFWAPDARVLNLCVGYGVMEGVVAAEGDRGWLVQFTARTDM